MDKKQIIFMGTPDYADRILRELIESKYDIALVLTQPDKPVGRKKILTPPPVKLTAIEYNLPLLQPKSLKDEEVISTISDIKPDFIVVAAYGQILPKEILNIAPCINLHASILPKYRGASPIQQVLLQGCKDTGVTAMLMNEGLDTGDILAYTKRNIPQDMMLSQLMDILADDASSLIIDVLDKFEQIEPIVQLDAASSHCKKITKADGEIYLDDALKIYNKFRAFQHWPGIFLPNGLKLTQISLNEADSIYEKEGVILQIDKDSFVVSCLKGSLKIYKVHPKSKKAIDAKAYLAGRRLGVGDSIL